MDKTNKEIYRLIKNINKNERIIKRLQLFKMIIMRISIIIMIPIIALISILLSIFFMPEILIKTIIASYKKIIETSKIKSYWRCGEDGKL